MNDDSGPRDWLVPLICLSLTHTLVDTCALTISPLWKRLDDTFSLGQMGIVMLFIAQSIPTSFSQMVFGYFRDRKPTPMLLWIGPLAAILLTTIGSVNQPYALFGLLIVGGIGVGAFHPEAAVTAARMIPGHQARGLSAFMFGGSLGLALGPVLSGIVTDQWGLRGLAVLAMPVSVCVIALRRIGRLHQISRDTHDESPSTRNAPGFGEMMAGRGSFAIALLLICSLRLVPNMAMDKILDYTLSGDQWGFNRTQVGTVQSLFLVAASVGMGMMAIWFRPGWEKPFMVACPLCGIPFLCLMGWSDCPQWLFIGSLIPLGAALWGTSPAMVSYAQQHFPGGAGMASAITMGMSWGVAGLIQAPITSWFLKTDRATLALWTFIPFLVLSALGASMMPSAPAASAEARS